MPYFLLRRRPALVRLMLDWLLLTSVFLVLPIILGREGFRPSQATLLLVGAGLAIALVLAGIRHIWRSLMITPWIEAGLGSLSAAFILCGVAEAADLTDSTVPGLDAAQGFCGAAIVAGGMLTWRLAAARWRVPVITKERIAILGTGELARGTADFITRRVNGNCRLVGFIDDRLTGSREICLEGIRRLGGVNDLQEISSADVDRIVVAVEDRRGGRFPAEELVSLRVEGVRFEEVAPFMERTGGVLAVDTVAPSWLLFSRGFRQTALRWRLKRVSDFVLAAGMLLAASPVMLLAAIAVRLESAGPALYRQTRVGLNGRPFEILKFRSMVEDAEAASGPVWASVSDSRVTRIGGFIRRTRIDELPQLFNVLKGEMSFVGPRPERPVFVEKLNETIHYYRLRTGMRPGITGWAQVQFRYGASADDAKEKLTYDLYYIKHAGPVLDLWIILKTVFVVVARFGSR